MKKFTRFLLFSILFITTTISFAQSDDCPGTPIRIIQYGWVEYPGSVKNATESYRPNPNCISSVPTISTIARDVWFNFRAFSTSVVIEAVPYQQLDPALEVFSACSSSASIICHDNAGGRGDAESVSLNNLTLGNDYYIRVYHYTTFPRTNTNGITSTPNFTLRINSIPPPRLDAPTVTATKGGVGCIDVSWTKVTAATSYKLYKDGQYVSNYTGQSTQSCNLGEGTRHCYQVEACNTTGNCSNLSLEACATAGQGNNSFDPPILNASEGSLGCINVDWNSVSGASYYEVYENNSFIKRFDNVTSGQICGLGEGSNHCYKVKACKTSGICTALSNYDCADAGKSNTTTKYTITVLTNPSDGSGGTANGGGQYDSGSSATLQASEKNGYSFKDWTDNLGNTYTGNPLNRIVTRNITYTANFIRNIVDDTPDSPTNVDASELNCTEIKITWDKVTNATKYIVFNANTNEELGQVTAPMTVFIHKNLNAGVQYSYYVKACKTNCSSSSVTKSARIKIDAPDITVSLVTLGRILIKWNAIACADKYKVYRDNQLVETISNGETKYLSIDNIRNHNYCFYVVACKDAYCSAKSNEICAENKIPYIDIRNLRFTAENIAPLLGEGVFSLTGDIKVGLKNIYPNSRIIKLSGILTADTVDAFFKGNGALSIEKGQKNGNDLRFYNGSFEFSVATSISSLLNAKWALGNDLKLAGMTLKIDKFNTLPDGINIEGDLSLPDALKHFDNNQSVDFRLRQVQIRQNQGIDVAGSISLNRLKVMNGLRLDNTKFSFDNIQNKYSGATTIHTSMLDLSVNVDILNGKLDGIGGSYAPRPPKPLGFSGLAMSKIGFNVENLVNKNDAISLTLEGSLVPATEVALKLDALRFDLTAKYRLGSSFDARGDLLLFGKSFADANFNLSGLDTENTKVSSDVGLDFCLLDARAKLTAANGNFRGDFNANVKLPCPSCIKGHVPDWLQKPLNKLNLPCDKKIITSQNILQNKALGGYTRLGFKLETGFGSVNLNYGELYYSVTRGSDGYPEFNMGTNYEDIGVGFKNHFSKNPFQTRSAVEDTTWYAFNVNKATQSLIIEAYGGRSGLPQFWIRTSSNDTITALNVSKKSHISYFENPTAHYAAYYFRTPRNGDFFVGVINADSINVKSALVRPSIELLNIKQNISNSTFTFDWSDECPDRDALISLGYDNDTEGGDGTIFMDSISQNSSINSYTWDYAKKIRTGKYYFYATIRDSIGLFRTVYYKTPFIVAENNIPNTPSDAKYKITGDTIQLDWKGNNEYPITYIVYYSNRPNTVSNLSENFAIINDTSFAFISFIPGRYYEFMITAVDTFGKESTNSNVIKFTFRSSVNNNIPFIKTIKESKDICHYGNTYSTTIVAEDLDSDKLIYTLVESPTGMTINANTGQITWQPQLTENHYGYNTVKVKVTDGKDGFDSIRYQIQVLDTEGATAMAQFNKALYLGYDDRASVFIKDDDFEGKANAIDSIAVKIYSTTDPIGFNTYARENGLNSNEFITSFLFDSTTTANSFLKTKVGDTIWVSLIDASMNKKVFDFSYFTKVKADFQDINFICANDSIRFKNISTGSGFKYEWDLGDGAFSNEKHPVHTYAKIYGGNPKLMAVKLKITDNDGRTSTVTKQIKIIPLPIADFADTVNACYKVTLDAGNPNSKYLWHNGKTSQTINLDLSQKVHVKITNSFDCVNTDSTELTIYKYNNPLFNHINLDLGDSIRLDPYSHVDASLDWKWLPKDWLSCTQCSITDAKPIESLTYIASSNDRNGCFVQDTFKITVSNKRKVFIPNVFSPNNDGQNDVFMVYAGNEVRIIKKFQVFNRWGGQLFSLDNFQPNDITKGWDGYFKGQLLDIDTFIYFLEVEYINGKAEVFKGDVSIIR
jgi:gliding motility-associated-like protein